MIEIDALKAQIEEYKNEWKKTDDNRTRLMDMLAQQEKKLEQLSGAIFALERIMTETERKQITSQTEKEESTDDKVNDTGKSAQSQDVSGSTHNRRQTEVDGREAQEKGTEGKKGK